MRILLILAFFLGCCSAALAQEQEMRLRPGNTISIQVFED